MGALRIALLALAALLLVAQLVPVDTTNPPVRADVDAPPEVHALLQRACYDCHSNVTVWPWYSRVAPVSWLVAHDVSEGREKLDFSTWDAYSAVRRRKKLRETAAEVAEGEMPPWYYALVHPEARLSAAERDLLRDWATGAGGEPAR